MRNKKGDDDLDGNRGDPRNHQPVHPGSPGGPPPDLKDWQKETWYGGSPADMNPFDEPEDAPELREERSESLNNREGAFWSSGQTTGYRYGGNGGKTAPAPPPKKPAKKRSPWVYVLFTLATGVVIWAVSWFLIFNVRSIRVEGNQKFTDEEVIALSGLRKGQPLLGLNAEDVARNLQKNVYLRFRYLEKELPDTVILSVKEREACCWMTWCGIFYTMDKERMVLFETEEEGVRPSNLVRVDGLRIRSGCMVGQTLMLESEEQQSVFTTLFLEMKVLGCTEDILEVDLSNLSSLLLTTRDGFTVRLGDAVNLHAKLRSMMLTREELLRKGYNGGIINVVNLENPIFSPQ